MKHIISRITLLLLCCAGFHAAQGQSIIPITGNTETCRGAIADYQVTPSPGISYTWTLSGSGNFVGNPMGPLVSISWTGWGNAQLTVEGRDSADQLIETGDINMHILTSPNPKIEWDSRVGCQIADPEKEDDTEDGTVYFEDIDDGACIRVCASNAVTYWVSNPTGGPLNWTVAGGSILGTAGNSCVVIWDGPGYGSIGVTEGHPSPNENCTGTTEICIEIIASPSAAFAAIPEITSMDHIVACENKDIHFMDQSVDNGGTPIASWHWDFGDGQSSIVQNPVHAYASPGNYEVILTVTNECNCSHEISRHVEVHPNDEPVIIECPSVVCEGAMATYRLIGGDLNHLHDCLLNNTANWEVIGGTIIGATQEIYLQVQWDNVGPDGFGYVIFNQSPDCGSPCPAPTVVKVPVIRSQADMEGPLAVCPKQQYKYSLPRWPATVFDWEINTTTGAQLFTPDQPNEIILITELPGQVGIKGSWENTLTGCKGTSTITLEVSPPIPIIGNEEVCAGSAHYYGLPSPYSGDWELKGPNGYSQTSMGTAGFNAGFPEAGSYILNVTGDFCLDKPMEIYVQGLPPPPDEIMGGDSICLGIPYVFTAGASMPGTLFEWTVNGGAITGSPAGPEVTVVFSGTGPYQVNVSRRNIRNPKCTSTPISKQLYPEDHDLGIIGNGLVCPNTTVPYQATYGGGETYEWEIIPETAGSVSSGNNGPNIEILWNHAVNTVNAHLTLKMRKCNRNTYVDIPITINPMPDLSLSAPADICNGENLQITANGAGANTVDWTYDNGGSFSGNPFNQQVNAPNDANTTYTFTATINNPNGCPGSVSESIAIPIKQKPVVAITPAMDVEICPPDPIDVPLTAVLQSGFQQSQNLEWFHDGISVSTCNGPPFACALYQATDLGNYHVIATGTNGCTDLSNTVTISEYCDPGPDGPCTISPLPTLSLSMASNDGCGNFTLNATHSPGQIASGWDYGAGLSAQSQSANSITLSANKAGYYSVSFWTQYPDGSKPPCRFSDKVSLTIPLVTDIRYTAVCGDNGTGYDLNINDHSNILPTVTNLSYDYYVNGNLEQANSPNPSLLLANQQAGVYDLQIAVSYTYNGQNHTCFSDILQVVLPDLPNASFAIGDRTPACKGYPVEFLNSSTPAGLKYMWNFSGNAFSTVENPHRVYAFPSIYNPSLTVTNEFGCSNRMEQTVEIVENELGGRMEVSPSTTVCEGTPVELGVDYSTYSLPQFYSWMEDTTLLLTTGYQPIQVQQSGYYWASLGDIYGCVAATPAMAITVLNLPEPVIVGDQYYCEGEEVKLYGYAGPGITYQWLEANHFGGPVPGMQSDALSIALPPGDYSFSLQITHTSEAGDVCTAQSDPLQVTVSTPPAPPAIDYHVADCEQYRIELNASHNDPGNFTWSNGRDGPNIEVFQGGPYKVWFDNGMGCRSSNTLTVNRNPEEYLWVFPTGCYELCWQDMPKGLHGPIIPFQYWEWHHDLGNNHAGSGPVDIYEIQQEGNYHLYLENQWCGKQSGNMDLRLSDCGDCHFEFNANAYCNPHPNDPCAISFDLNLYSNGPMNINLHSPMGMFLPSSILLMPGATPPTVDFFPNAAYVPGMQTIVLDGSYYNHEGQVGMKCRQEVNVQFPNLCCGQDNPEGKAGKPAIMGNRLQLLPNPARNQVNIRYRFENEANNKSIELYDMQGKMLIGEEVTTHQGALEWRLDAYAAGIYFVVMKTGDKTVEYRKLSITK